MKRTEINEIGNRKEKNEMKRNVDSLKKKSMKLINFQLKRSGKRQTTNIWNMKGNTTTDPIDSKRIIRKFYIMKFLISIIYLCFFMLIYISIDAQYLFGKC